MYAKGGMPVRKGGMRVNISEKGVTPVNSQKKGGTRVIRRNDSVRKDLTDVLKAHSLVALVRNSSAIKKKNFNSLVTRRAHRSHSSTLLERKRKKRGIDHRIRQSRIQRQYLSYHDTMLRAGVFTNADISPAIAAKPS